MKHIWSPWRMKYIRDHQTPKGCIFCDAVKHEDGVENLIVKRGSLAFVILNMYPYTSGHVMVVPYQHVGTLSELDPEALAEVMELIQQSIQAINSVYKPEGYNVGANLGAVAGAGIADHVHFHVVPRWGGDTNFMTAIGEARVLPEDLRETLAHLKAAWPE
jgi:ATP adenylyltransferase